jgi:hypothetical protein
MKEKRPSATSVHLCQFMCQHEENKLIAHNFFDTYQTSKAILVSHAIHIFLKHYVGNVCASVFSSEPERQSKNFLLA